MYTFSNRCLFHWWDFGDLFPASHQLYHFFKSGNHTFPDVDSIAVVYFIIWCKINDGSRWIKLPIINMTVQTSDLAKLALFMYISRLLSKKQEMIKDFKKGFLPVVTPVLDHLRIDHAGQPVECITNRRYFALLLMFIGR
jgi:cell division protein FtsW